MKKIIILILVIVILSATSYVGINAYELETKRLEELELTIFHNEDSFDGYILYAPYYGRNTYLIDNAGEIVHKWSSLHIVASSVYLLENGNLIRANYKFKLNLGFNILGMTGRIEMFNWEGKKIWNFIYANNKHYLNHDIEPLPNGNILMIAWEKKTLEEAITAGRNQSLVDNSGMIPVHIIEVKPYLPFGGKIVWEWHVWDHLIQDFDSSKDNYGIIADHPELIDINFKPNYYSKSDWLHCNSINYNYELDQILISCRNFNEIWVIDHSTTTGEAAGHTGGKGGKGGDLLYRWGNPQVYHAGNESDQRLFHQHDAQWIKSGYPGEGHKTIFNNGIFRPEGFYTSVEEIIPPIDEYGDYYIEPGKAFGPKDPIWTYTSENPSDFYAKQLSGSQRLPSGNTIICDGPAGRFFEVTSQKETIWEFLNSYPPNLNLKHVFKLQYYPPDYPGIRDLSTNKLG